MYLINVGKYMKIRIYTMLFGNHSRKFDVLLGKEDIWDTKCQC